LAAALVAVATLGATATAVGTFTDVQANDPQVAGDPTSNTTARLPTNKQNEPSIAANNAIAQIRGEKVQPKYSTD
jgi:hypothetical protein